MRLAEFHWFVSVLASWCRDSFKASEFVRQTNAESLKKTFPANIISAASMYRFHSLWVVEAFLITLSSTVSKNEKWNHGQNTVHFYLALLFFFHKIWTSILDCRILIIIIMNWKQQKWVIFCEQGTLRLHTGNNRESTEIDRIHQTIRTHQIPFMQNRFNSEIYAYSIQTIDDKIMIRIQWRKHSLHNFKLMVTFVLTPLTCLFASRNLVYAFAPSAEYAHVVHIYVCIRRPNNVAAPVKKVNLANIILMKAAG